MMKSDIPIVTKVRPIGPRTLRAHFAGDRRDYKLDLTGLIARSMHFEPLMNDAETFAKIEIVDDGIGVAWPIETKWGRLDLSGSTLRRIAEEQLPMTGADFSHWRTKLGLSLTEAAKLLGVGRRTVMGYLKKDELPPLVAIACRALARDKHLFAAHYVPRRKAARNIAGNIAHIPKALGILKRAGVGNPPMKGDRLRRTRKRR
jgi:hypothetical protein